MSGTEIVTVISGVLNVFAAIAGVFGWRRQKKLKDTAQRVERVGEAVIQGVEACEKVLATDEAKQVKRSVHKVAEAAGVEDDLHGWLAELGLARGGDRHNG